MLKQNRPQLTIDVATPNPRASQLAARPIFNHAIVSLTSTPEGQIAAVSADGRMRVWDRDQGKLLTEQFVHESWAFDLAFHPRKPWLATAGGDDLIKLWDWQSKTEIGRFVGHEDDVHAVAFTPDGTTLVSTGDDLSADMRGQSQAWRSTPRASSRHLPAVIQRSGFGTSSTGNVRRPEGTS
jgi:WD40 repeat protein